MNRRTNIDKPAGTKKDRYDFGIFKPGDSTHAKDAGERSRIMTAFKYWADKNPKAQGDAYATSLKVDATDPDGPGYRIWFMSRFVERQKAEQRRASNDI